MINDLKSFFKKNPWIIIPMILVMGYFFISDIIDFNSKKNSTQEWTLQDHDEMVKQCVLDTKEKGIKYPDLTKTYCICSIKQIQTNFTKSEYLEIINKPFLEQKDILLPCFKNCLTDYQNKIKLVGNNQSSN